MKHTMIKDALRNIRKNIVSWISIIIIAGLAVTAFLGIRFSADSIKINSSDFYNESNFRDLEILGTLLISEDDLDAVARSEGVKEVEGFRSADLKYRSGKTSLDIRAASIGKTVNLPSLLSGSYPSGKSECLIEKDLSDLTGLGVGDKIELPESKYLSRTSYTISGIAVHPDHTVIYSELPGTRYVLIDADNFVPEAFDNCYNAAEVVFDKDEDTNRYSKSYFSRIDPYVKSLEKLGKERAALRYDDIHDRYQAEIDKNRALLEDAEKQLADARAELDRNQELIIRGESDLAAAKKKLDKAKKELTAGKKQLEDAEKQLSAARAELNRGKNELDAGKAQLDEAEKKLREGYNKVLDYRDDFQAIVQQIADSNTPEGAEPFDFQWETSRDFDVSDPDLSILKIKVTKEITLDLTPFIDETEDIDEMTDEELTSLIKEDIVRFCLENYVGTEDVIRAALDQIDLTIPAEDIKSAREHLLSWEKGHKEYLKGLKEYREGLEKYRKALAEYNSKYQEYLAGVEKYNKGKAEYENGLKEYRAGQKKLREAKAELAAGEAAYQDGLKEYKKGLSKLAEAEKQLAAIGDSRWVFMTAKGSAAYVYSRALADNFANISSTFSLLFLFIGALVIYATAGKIIDEQRKLVGTTKALGFFNREIMGKYLSFGVTSTLLGILAGTAVSYFIIEKSMVNIQNEFFNIDVGKSVFELIPAAVVLVLGVILACMAVYLACSNLVRTPAVRLMQDAVPRGSGKAAKEKKHITSLYSRLMLRNMRADPKRVAVTIVSIAGSCALIVIGLTINHAMTSAIDLQFNDIYRYDYIIEYDSDVNSKADDEIEKILGDTSAEYIRVSYMDRAYQDGDELASTGLLCGDPADIAEYYHTADVKTGKDIDIAAEGIYVPQKADETSGFVRDGSITLYGSTMEPYNVKVNSAFRCYIAKYMIMSEDSYRSVFGGDVPYNQYLVRMDKATAKKVGASLENVDGIKSYMHSDERRKTFDSLIGIARAMVLLLTIMAFVMAYFILLNLINMFINQKKRELTVMRINGFTVKETKAYVGREMVITTLLGIVLGILAGSVLAYKIMLLLENTVCYDRSPYIAGWLISGAVTALLSLVISMIALRRVRTLKLTDI